MSIEELAQIAKALSDTNRLNIIKMLTKGRLCACELLASLEVTQPTLSHHMKILVECGLVNDRREGKWHHYSLNCDTLTEYKAFIDSLTCEKCSDGKGGCRS